MINSNLTLDEAFRLHKKQLDHLDAALAKIKEFPFSQYLHVGFDSGAYQGHYVRLQPRIQVAVYTERYPIHRYCSGHEKESA